MPDVFTVFLNKDDDDDDDDSPQLKKGINTYVLNPPPPHPPIPIPASTYLPQPSAIGTLINNENVDVQGIKNGNWKWMFSVFQCSDSTNSHSGS